MRTANYFIVAIFTAVGFAAMAEAKVQRADCADSDFSSSFGPVRNQGSANSCFAFVAADLIGFHEHLEPPDQISAFDVALNYLTIDPKKLEGSAVATGGSGAKWIRDVEIPALELAHEKQRGRNVWSRLSDGGAPALALLSYNHSGGYCLENQLASQGQSDQESSQFLFSKITAFSQRYLARELQKQCPGADIAKPSAELLPLIKKINDLALVELRKETESACARRSPIKPCVVEANHISKGNDSIAAAVLAKAVRAGVPLAIGYDSGFLTNGEPSTKDDSPHTSIVVGTRWNTSTNSCEYKVRNSWGSSCHRYNKDFATRCEGGHVWLTESEINATTDTLIGIDP